MAHRAAAGRAGRGGDSHLRFYLPWTEFLLALYLTSTYAVTVPVTLAGWITGQAELIGEISALALLSVVPIFVISLFVQRHFVRGLTMGAVKT